VTTIGNPCISASGEIASGIGSDPKHTAWCSHVATGLIRTQRQFLGPSFYLLSHDVREALLMASVLNVICGYENSDAPVWRVQELIQITRHLFLHGGVG